MTGVEIQTLTDKWIITVDKTVTDVETIDNFLKRLSLEEISRKANYNEEKIMELAE